jgi:hypothetical protein
VQLSQIPTKFPAVWAHGAVAPYINTIPAPSQQSVRSGAASLFDGFPPLCFVPIATGGAGPFGGDTNGILNQITGGLQWQQAGAPFTFDPAWAAAVGGYPLGSLIPSDSTPGQFWYSTVDNNSADPDTGGANWLSFAMLLGGTTNAQIIQTGRSPAINLSGGVGQVTTPFPNAFPHACLGVIGWADGIDPFVVGSAVVFAGNTYTASNFNLLAATPAQPTSTATVHAIFVAVGY